MKKIFFLIIALSLYATALSRSDREEMRIGEKTYKRVLRHSVISHNRLKNAAIQRVGRRLAKVSNKNYNWKFTLVKNRQANAFCLPGGKVVVYTGLFKIIKNDDQLATVLGHEIAHALLRHGTNRVKLSRLATLPQIIGKKVLGDVVPKDLQPVLDKTYNIGKELAVVRPYSRHNELEADKLGINLVYKAGYNTDESIKFWQNMKRRDKKHIPVFLSTHPSNSTRLARIKREIKRLKREK